MPPRPCLRVPALLSACALGLAAIACKRGDTSSPEPPADAGDDTATWLGEAGLLPRAPADRPLRALCGIASNPGDMPTGDDPTSAAKRKGYFDAVKDLGATMIRRDFLWQEIEPERGKLDFKAQDRLVDEAQAAGVKLLGMLAYGNGWASARSKGDPYWPPDDPKDYASFVKATVSHYAGKVSAWEIWNEPNNGWRFWKTNLYGEPAAYGTLLKAAHAAAREADPAAPVLLGGTVFTPQLIHGAIPWLMEAYAAHPDLATAFEVAGIHTYMTYPPERPPERGEDEDPPLVGKLQMHAWLLAQHGGEKKPMWITEIGWPVSAKVDEAAQARFTVRATILSARHGAEGVFWYTLRDGPKPTEFPPEDAFGLLHNDGKPLEGKDGTPKRVYLALKAMLARVGDRAATARDPRLSGLPEDGNAVVFHGATGGDVIAVWTVDTAASTARFAGRAGEVFDQLGVSRGAVAADATFAIGPDVTYVMER